MKKSLLFCGVAALAFASCTQNEVLDVNENRAIGFDAFSGKATRADITGNGGTGSTFTKFFVFGSYDKNGDGSGYTSVYSNGEVAYNSGWSAKETQYWVADKNYKFAAYSDGNAALPEGTTATFTDATGKLKIENYQVADKDLILAEEATGDGTTKGNVSLSFSHLLSKVKFTFTSDFTSPNYTMTISGMKFNAGKTGTYDDSNWNTTSNADYEIGGWNNFVGGASESSDEYYVLPQATSSLEVTLTVSVTDGGSFNKTKELKASLDVTNGTDTGKWMPGYVYNYTATITPEKVDPDLNDQVIKFTVDVDSWQDHNSGSDPIDPEDKN